MENNKYSDKKVLCAVRNPKIQKEKVWLYNIFFGRCGNVKNKPQKHEMKIDWLMTIDEEDVERLEEKGCKVIKLSEDVEITPDSDELSQYKSGCKVLISLFERLMNNNGVKSEIKKELTNNDGKPSKDYKIILNTKKILED